MIDLAKTIEKHSLKTHAILKSSEMTASGWDSNIVDPLITAGPQSFCYVWDQATQWVWMCSASREGFNEITNKSSKMLDHKIQEIRGSLGYVIGQCADKTINDKDWETNLGIFLAAYAGTTKVWKAADKMKEGGNFIVLNYRELGASESMLRPFIIPDVGNAALNKEDLMDRIHTVFEMDQSGHPEWFNTNHKNQGHSPQ